MATPLTFKGSLPFSREQYIAQYFNAESVAYFSRHMALDEYKLEVLKTDGPIQIRTIRAAPRLDLPRWVLGAMGVKRISYLETTTHTTGSASLEWNVITNILTEKIDIQGHVLIEKEGPKRCRYTIEGDVAVRIYGAGPRIEEAIVASTLEAYKLTHELTLVYHQSLPNNAKPA